MTKLFLATAALALALGGVPAAAQQSPGAKPDPCPPAARQTTGSTSSEYAKGPPEKQPMEHSAIVPNAGGHQESAAPTVQQNGKPVEASTECPKEPNQLNAPNNPKQ
jgi:hypothetical protein